MGNIAIITDSNSGITQAAARELGIRVLPMPFYINEELFFEDITLTQEEFYRRLAEDADISTSQPAPGDVTELWDRALEECDQVVYIPMSSGLSASCETAMMLSADYKDRVFVVDNQRISITQRQSVLDQQKQLEDTLLMLDYKRWYYQTAQEAGTCAVHDSLTPEQVPEQFRALTAEWEKG